MNPGTRVDHSTFCVNEEWEKVRDARGSDVGHHVTYELPLPDGRVLRTRISRPVRKVTYGPGLWKCILRDQLDATEQVFWACVRDKVKPERAVPDLDPGPRAIPAQLVYQLIHQAGIPDSEVAAMSLAQALEAMTTYWSTPPEG